MPAFVAGESERQDPSAALHQVLLVVGVARELGARGDFTLGVKLGGIVAGDVTIGGTRGALEPGMVGGVSLDWRVLRAPRSPVSLTLGLQLGVGYSELADEDWLAVDLRASATVSRTFADRLTPYVSARVFGGPVLWADAMGTDTTHLQLAAGLTVGLWGGVSLHVEGAVLSERGLFVGIGAEL